MIRTSTQLKAKVRNLSEGDNNRARVLIRNYVMERFLERISLSKYKDNFILKGGMLVSSMVGLETRATMDIDTTINAFNLDAENARKILDEIISIPIDDGMNFTINGVSDIMEGHDYPGLRFMVETTLDKLKQAIKIDISTGDVITPHAVRYNYPLMFEERSIALWAYNLETLLAEKLETIMSRGIANTRMRDFYDIHTLTIGKEIDYSVLYQAFIATSKKRETLDMIPRLDEVLSEVSSDLVMGEMWNKYRRDNFFVGELTWEDVNRSVEKLKNNVMIQLNQ